MKLKKKKGSVLKFAPILLGVLVAAMLITMHTSWTNDLDKKDKIDILAREYILMMESKGFLTGENETELIQELQNFGLVNISLAGTTRQVVPYGSEVVLVINGTLHVNKYDLNDYLDMTKESVALPVLKKLTSTAKH